MVFGFCHHLSLLKRRRKKNHKIYVLVDIIYAGKIKKKSSFCLQLIK